MADKTACRSASGNSASLAAAVLERMTGGGILADGFVESHKIPCCNRLLGIARHGFGRAVRLGFGQTIFAFHVVAGLDRHGPQGDELGAQDNADLLAAEGAADPVPQVRPCLGDGECLHVHRFASQ